MVSIINKRAINHDLHCEDNFFIFENGEKIIGAVLDGCSSGKDAWWASKLISNILSKIQQEWNDFSAITTDSSLWDAYVNEILFQTSLKIRDIVKVLDVDWESLLSTIVFFVYDKENEQLYVKFIGDGVFFVKKDGEWYDIENNENNMPLYLGYYFDKENKSLMNFIQSRRTELVYGVEEFSISSDGIYSFSNIKEKELKQSIPIEFLIKEDLTFRKLKHELGRKFNMLADSGWIINDDLTIIKYKNI